MKKLIIKAISTASLVLLFAIPAQAESLDLSEGTMAIGGSAGISLNSDVAFGDFGNGAWVAGADLSFQYFFMNNFSFALELHGDYGFGGANDKGVGIGAAIAYYFDTGSNLSPYLGAGVHSDWDFSATTDWELHFPVTVGLLVAMNSSVALDFGIKADIGVPLNGGDAHLDKGSGGGYMGVRAFF